MSTKSSKLLNTTIRSQSTTYSVSLDCIVLPKITVDIPTVPLDLSNWKIPHGIQLADPKCYTPSKIDMLVCSEIFMELLCNESNLKDTYPNFTKTKLG